MKTGDHLVTPRAGYTHHGLYIGNGKVIHYSGCANGFSRGEISITSIDKFANGRKVSVKKHVMRTYSEDESVDRAYQRIGEDWYDVLFNNCEHFVTWCIVGVHLSSQVNQMVSNIAMAYKFSKTAAESVTTAEVFAGSVTGRSIEREAVRMIASSSAKSAISTTVSTGSGLVAGLSTATGTTATTVGLITGASVTPLAPVFAAVAVGYGVKKALDWLWD